LAGALAGLAGLAVTACEVDKKDLPAPPTTNRSNAVVAPTTPGGSAKPSAPGGTGTAQVAAPQPPRQLCVGQSPKPPPKGVIKTAAAPGATPPPASMPFGVGKWVWVNLWAAWCKPCKEEMPRLIAWQKKLSAAGVLLELAFVSIDDDERELERFLEGQPAAGVRASYWLPEGSGRSSWLGALGLKETPDLPAHALVAPSGQVTCLIQGAVEDRDYPAVAAFVGAKP
jgi:thiol-disulfide isomerase/thioredoxin